MIDTHTEVRAAIGIPRQQTHLLWPALATLVAYPIFMVIASTFFLWMIHLFDPPHWLATSSLLLLAVVGLYATWRLMSTWANHNFQFSLRGLFVAMSVAAILLGTAGRTFQQRMAVMDVVANGGSPEGWFFEEKNWLETHLGYDPFNKVQFLDVRADQAIPSLLKHPEVFAELEQLSFCQGSSDASLRYASDFNKLPKLTSGAFYRTTPTDHGIQHLKDWTRVRSLFFNGSPFTDKGLAHLEKLPELESLTLIGDEGPGMSITDQGLTHIGKMSHLKLLSLTGIPITDAGLKDLRNLTHLEKLLIHRSGVTKKGLQQLCRVLPDCWVSSDWNHFPVPTQIRQIAVWKETPTRQQLLTISDPDQIVAIMKWLEKFSSQNPVGWKRDWDSKSQENISLDIEGPHRCLCQMSFENDFFYSGWGSRCPFSNAHANELRRLLGVEATAR